MSQSNWQDRIVDLVKVPGRDLMSHPGNWRDHPQFQVEVMRDVLDDIGIIDALLAYQSETYGKLVVLNGHLRKDLDPDVEWPVLILDLTDEEALKALTTHDRITELAQTDPAALDALIGSFEPATEAISKLLKQMAAEAGLFVPETNPDIDYDTLITGEDVDAAREGLDVDYNDSIDKTEVFCPYCGEQFFVATKDVT
jgi:hypothetical protein